MPIPIIAGAARVAGKFVGKKGLLAFRVGDGKSAPKPGGNVKTTGQLDSAAFERGLASAIADLERGAHQKAKEAADDMAADMRTRVPRRTGALAATIATRPLGRADNAVVAGSAMVDYDDYVEYGTSDTHAQPYKRPAWQKVRNNFLRGKYAPKLKSSYR